ncbi:MAG: ComEC family competence protein [Chitinophagaceae bacterium]|nr:ComEC family competence protein [Chitinophagaceae bacterium]
MENMWREAPFIRFVIPFMLGISIQLTNPISDYWVLVCIGIPIILLYFSFNFLPVSYQFTLQFMKGILLSCLILFLGYCLPFFHTSTNATYYFEHHLKKSTHSLVKVLSSPDEKDKTYKVDVEVVQLMNNKNKTSCSGQAILYIQKNDRIQSIQTGDQLLINNHYRQIPTTSNPGSFDYKRYCALKNIFYTAYIPSNEWMQVGKRTQTLSGRFDHLNETCRHILQQCLKDSTAFGLAEALLVGYKKNMDQETMQAYSKTGIAHIIAISGMHMALVYSSLKNLLMLLPIFKSNRKIAIVIALTFMWFFALLTGLPPSVTRAACMFSFLAIGELSDRKITSYNNLAASAFMLLCINPNWLADIGFQLSYLAVLSLQIFYSRIYSQLYFKQTLIDISWKLLAATIAAQILTFPLCIYYFHQFPILFLLTNLVAIPATTLILYLEIITLLFSWIKPLAAYLGKVIVCLIHWLNTCIKSLSQLEFISWNQLHIQLWQMMLLFGIVIVFTLFASSKKFKQLVLALVMCIVLLSSFTLDIIKMNKQQYAVIYQAPKQSVLDFFVGHQYYSPDEKSYEQQPKIEQYIIQPAHTYYEANSYNPHLIHQAESQLIDFYHFKGKTIARLKQPNFKTTTPIQIDYLLISFKGIIKMNQLIKHFKFKYLILDGNSSIKNLDSITLFSKQHGIKLHSISKDGAFVLKL